MVGRGRLAVLPNRRDVWPIRRRTRL